MTDDIQEYPKWVPVDGEGHPDMPGYELAEDAKAEKALTKRKSDEK